jgi:RNA polymerase sigma factor for flagellar operon FliA
MSTLTRPTTPDSRRVSQAEALALWRRYKATGDARLRDRLIMTYAPLVKYIVYRKIREVPAHQEADYISHGLEALITSIDRYDPSKGATLEQYLWTRIHGAVLDELRRQDWAPRSVRRFDRQVTAAARSFRAIHHREPTEDELADSLAVSVDDLRGHRADLIRADVGSLHSAAADAGDDEQGVERIETLHSEDARTRPEHAALLGDAKRAFREAFDTLSTREQEVAVLLYVKHLTLQEVGHVIGVTESRVSQIHSGLRKKLRERLHGYDDALALMDA